MQQTNSSFEIIVVDDGSTDSTKDVLLKLHQHYPNTLSYITQNNCGAGSARNAGINLAKGEFLLFLDADDELRPEALTQIEKAILSSPHSKLFLSNHLSKPQIGETRKHHVGLISNDKSKNFKNFLNKKINMAHGAFVAHNSLFKNIKYPIDLQAGEDIPVFAQLLAYEIPETIDHSLVVINKHKDSLRHHVFSNKEEALMVSERLFDKKILAPQLLKYKRFYLSKRCLSLSRTNYAAKQYIDSRKWYREALYYNPVSLFELSYFRKFIKSFFKK